MLVCVVMVGRNLPVKVFSKMDNWEALLFPRRVSFGKWYRPKPTRTRTFCFARVAKASEAAERVMPCTSLEVTRESEEDLT